MGKRSRRKGHAWERTVAKRLAAVLGVEVERNLEEVRHGLGSDLKTDAPLIVQCKCGQAPSVWRAVKEAQEAADGTGRFAVAIVRRNASSSHQKPEDLAVLSLDDFEAMLAQLRACGAW